MSKIGVDNLHFYPLIKDDETGVSYGAAVAVPGTVSLEINPSTDNATLYADNMAWETANSMGEVEVSIELADLPKSVQAALLGHSIDTTTGRLIAKSTDESPYVGISFAALKGNGATRYVRLAKGRFIEGEDNYQTKGESVEFQTQTINANFVVRKYDRVWKETVDSDDKESGVAATIADWFNDMGV
jgi:phi13 family phage major tail protein